MLKNAFQHELMEAGCDEAGRGCLAGPVFAAAVILPHTFRHPLLNDSKKISEKIRYQLREEIQSKAIAWAVASSGPGFIDQHNILRASILTMHKAISMLSATPGFLIIDGNYFIPYQTIPYKCIVKGDATFGSIAAASILAKTYRDEYMKNLNQQYPQYGWEQNKGYPTKAHREAIRVYGITEHHRRSFNLLPRQTEIRF